MSTQVSLSAAASSASSPGYTPPPKLHKLLPFSPSDSPHPDPDSLSSLRISRISSFSDLRGVTPAASPTPSSCATPANISAGREVTFDLCLLAFILGAQFKAANALLTAKEVAKKKAIADEGIRKQMPDFFLRAPLALSRHLM